MQPLKITQPKLSPVTKWNILYISVGYIDSILHYLFVHINGNCFAAMVFCEIKIDTFICVTKIFVSIYCLILIIGEIKLLNLN